MKPTSIILRLLFLWMANANAVEPQISAGKYQNMAIDSDGAVYMWSASAIPLHSSVKSLWHPEDGPTKAADIPPAIGVAAGIEEYVEILAEDGAVYEWGYGPIQNQKAKSRLPMAASP